MAFPDVELPSGWFLIVGRLSVELREGTLVLRVRSFESEVDLTTSGERRRVVVWAGEAEPEASTGLYAGVRAEAVGGGQVRFVSDRRLLSDLIVKVDFLPPE